MVCSTLRLAFILILFPTAPVISMDTFADPAHALQHSSDSFAYHNSLISSSLKSSRIILDNLEQLRQSLTKDSPNVQSKSVANNAGGLKQDSCEIESLMTQNDVLQSQFCELATSERSLAHFCTEQKDGMDSLLMPAKQLLNATQQKPTKYSVSADPLILLPHRTPRDDVIAVKVMSLLESCACALHDGQRLLNETQNLISSTLANDASSLDAAVSPQQLTAALAREAAGEDHRQLFSHLRSVFSLAAGSAAGPAASLESDELQSGEAQEVEDSVLLAGDQDTARESRGAASAASTPTDADAPRAAPAMAGSAPSGPGAAIRLRGGGGPTARCEGGAAADGPWLARAAGRLLRRAGVGGAAGLRGGESSSGDDDYSEGPQVEKDLFPMVPPLKMKSMRELVKMNTGLDPQVASRLDKVGTGRLVSGWRQAFSCSAARPMVAS